MRETRNQGRHEDRAIALREAGIKEDPFAQHGPDAQQDLSQVGAQETHRDPRFVAAAVERCGLRIRRSGDACKEKGREQRCGDSHRAEIIGGGYASLTGEAFESGAGSCPLFRSRVLRRLRAEGLSAAPAGAAGRTRMCRDPGQRSWPGAFGRVGRASGKLRKKAGPRAPKKALNFEKLKARVMESDESEDLLQ